MRSQLLQEEEEGYEEYKSVKVRISGDIFMGNTRADEPIFKKKDLNYDKHELAKLISFENFEILMRPFKNDPDYRKCKFWQTTYLTSFVFFIVIIFALIPLNEFVEGDSPLLILWQVMISITFFVFICSPFRVLFVLGNAKKALKTYCESLDLTLEHLSITAVIITGISNPIKWYKTIKQAPGKYSLFWTEFSHFQIKSSRILNDQTTIKLYNRGHLLSGRNANMDSPIYQDKDFEFNKVHLEKIIPFTDLEALVRPFKNNEFFQRIIIYMRVPIYLLFMMVFAIIPIFFDMDQITFILIQYGYAAFLCVVILLISCKAARLRKQMYIDFVEFCQEVSRGQQRVDIIAHIYESDRPSRRRQAIYCIQVKVKDH